ncbi:MAG: SAM-dependent methyltransferase [Actinomadura sp.]
MADEDHRRSAAGFDVTVPSPARIYDHLLGGKDNFAADRELVEAILRRDPGVQGIALANRRFLGRAVEFLAKAGIRQFLDLGTGLPSQNNVHEVAQRVCPDVRVVYVDNDPVVLNHAEALLGGDESTVVLCEDMREPERILAHPDVRRMIDFSQPVAVMFVAALHFVTDEQDPWGIVSAMTEPLIPGSYLTLSHSFLDGPPADVIADLQETYKHASAQAAVPRSREAITRFFDGFELVDPGLVHLTEWHSDEEERARPGGEWMLAGVGRKR